VILACSKTLVEKRIAENRTQDHYVWENISGQSHVSSKTEDIAELKEMLQMTV